MLSNHLFLITNVIHAESIVDIDTTIYNDLNQESIENNNENSDSNSRSSSPDSSSGHNNDDEQRTSSSSASESLTSTTANDFGIHDDEQILQTIHAISEGKYCTASMNTATGISAIGTFPSSIASSSSSHSMVSAMAIVNVSKKIDDDNSDQKIKNQKLNRKKLRSNQQRKRATEQYQHHHHHHHHIHKSMIQLNQNNEMNKLESIYSRFHHQQINLLLLHEKQHYIRHSLTNNEQFRRVEKCIDLLARILGDYEPFLDRFQLLNQTIMQTPLIESKISSLSIAWNDESSSTSSSFDDIKLQFFQCNETMPTLNNNNNNSSSSRKKCHVISVLESMQVISKWFSSKLLQKLKEKRIFHHQNKNDSTEWSNLFYDCHHNRWFITYHSLILQAIYDNDDDDGGGIDNLTTNKTNANDNYDIDYKYWFRVRGIISADIDVTDTDINQCGEEFIDETKTTTTTTTSSAAINEPKEWRTTLNLYGTHKCHNENSECIFISGLGMYRGGYQCRCKIGFHSTVTNLGPKFNGTLMERSYQDKQDGKSPAYDYMFKCEHCQPGCDQCQDNSPCLSSYNYAFRISLLTITILCIIFTFILALNIYRYRRLKVIKVASPIFLCITLLGCASMYIETIMIFPVMNTTTCVLTKWTRNFGFCLTYSSLLLKTWRVSLTYRVKSAHKIKLTDKQLLQWLFPILLVMVIYLGAWTISDTPKPNYIVDWNNLKFKQCDYSWWDHSLTIGEFLFLLWGIKVCYNVRNAQSLFDEAKYITWAIYNITIVNMVVILIHIFILPDSGPDIKYFFGFLRTQLSTTTTVILIFGPKFYRVIKGEGDLWNPRARCMMADTFAFNNGIGLAHEETTDLYQENDDLKREIQKLAAQLELMKLCQMEFRNRHLNNHLKFSRIQQQQSQSD
nr:probable G-protein coupled receptor CG31760 [Dermatophagoides farinae]